MPSLHTILVSFLSAAQAISSTALSIIHIYKCPVHTIKKVHNSSPPPHTSPAQPPTAVPQPVGGNRSCAIAVDSRNLFHTKRALTVAVSRRLCQLASECWHTPTNAPRCCQQPAHPPSPNFSPCPPDLPGWRSCSSATRSSRRSHPSLTGTLPLLRLLRLSLTITALVTATKHSLFPNGYPALPPTDPTPEEQAVLRSELVRRLAQAVHVS